MSLQYNNNNNRLCLHDGTTTEVWIISTIHCTDFSIHSILRYFILSTKLPGSSMLGETMALHRPALLGVGRFSLPRHFPLATTAWGKFTNPISNHNSDSITVLTGSWYHWQVILRLSLSRRDWGYPRRTFRGEIGPLPIAPIFSIFSSYFRPCYTVLVSVCLSVCVFICVSVCACL